MFNNILHRVPSGRLVKARVWVVAAAMAAVAGSFAVSAQADHHKDKHHHKSGKWQVITEMEGKGFLGVQMQELTDEMREGLNVKTEYGVLISTVIEDSPAAKAGLEEGDIVVRFDGKKVASPEELRELVAEMEAGSEVKVRIIRDDQEQTLEVTLGEWDEDMAFGMGNFRLENFDWDDMPQFVHALMPRRLGVNVSSIDENLAPYFGVNEGDGLLVLSVSDESMAEEMGIQSGDIITEVAGEAVDSTDDVRDALHKIDEGEAFEVKVVRNKKDVTLEGKMREDDTSVRVRNALRWHGDSPRIHIEKDSAGNEELKKEIDELRAELEEIKKELKKSNRR